LGEIGECCELGPWSVNVPGYSMSQYSVMSLSHFGLSIDLYQRVSLGEEAKRAHENGDQMTLRGRPNHQGSLRKANRTKFEDVCWTTLKLLVSPST
jgi:hypothetical protein